MFGHFFKHLDLRQKYFAARRIFNSVRTMFEMWSVRSFVFVMYYLNRPRSIYQYSNMTPRLSGQSSIFGVVSFVLESLLGIERQKNL